MTGHFKGHGLLYKTNFDSLTGRIVVLDWGANKEVAQLKLDEPAGNPSDGLSQSALALSPDGKYLAVLLHHTLTCYRLP
jgi:DNA-binding beta-propeller fold protein YncE